MLPASSILDVVTLVYRAGCRRKAEGGRMKDESNLTAKEIRLNKSARADRLCRKIKVREPFARCDRCRSFSNTLWVPVIESGG
jgi:hypothetical protein